ncbi:beta-Casp domain protein [Leptospira broomii serovar Hurstbridge str. 5399]|uniref:Beta-Casp domain protein n=1 Tax=Leptospira broomii serovar Hurstbridge str. 5399 TaxID=1049789 RepID=T0G8R2_9LEPT|nr:MBL fold metallo-hydrolase [Leptospira broomii]EQA43209.1 beta-Casp domain protein [Leptospira broomii serovar Hurstbridge str. 5399]
MNSEIASLRFLGAVGTVTGSKYLLTVLGKNILIDCGLFQGVKELRLRNWDVLPAEAEKIDVILLTHGHLDHTGYLPRLVKSGFSGSILATAPTLDVAEIILKDSAHLQEEDAEAANRHGYSKHSPALPLYEMKDVEKTISFFRRQEIGVWFDLFPRIRVRFFYAGHILGASSIEIQVNGKTFLFSGDLGRKDDPLLFPPEKPKHADLLLIESTYGNRLHSGKSEDKFASLINEFAEKKGSIIIPSFAVERTQLLMYLLWKLRIEGRIPSTPVYMDSPMGLHILEIFRRYGADWHKINKSDLDAMCEQITIVQHADETKHISALKGPKIVIAGSGMATGGRVLTYLEETLKDPNSLVLLAGYQAEGTRGRNLLDGKKEIKIRGKWHPVRCSVDIIDGFSAHADQAELVDWLSDLKGSDPKIYIVHGEKDGAEGLEKKIKETYGWEPKIPEYNFVAYLTLE